MSLQILYYIVIKFIKLNNIKSIFKLYFNFLIFDVATHSQFLRHFSSNMFARCLSLNKNKFYGEKMTIEQGHFCSSENFKHY